MQNQIVDEDGNKCWFDKNKDLHRDNDLPAVIRKHGTQDWFRHGKRHRDHGPAIIYASGNETWYKDGEKHREDGPAIIWFDGMGIWYLKGKEYSKEEHRRIVNAYKVVFVMLRI